MDAKYEARLHSPKKQSPSNRPPIVSEDARRRLNFSPKEIYFDRTIPSMTASNLEAPFSLLTSKETVVDARTSPNVREESNSPSVRALYRQILQNELLGQYNTEEVYVKSTSPQTSSGVPTQEMPISPSRLFSYKSARKQSQPNDSPYSLSPMGLRSQQLLSSPKKPQRKIPKVPFKVLEAPQIQDDFYLNLVDWSSQNLLAVGLGQSVYLWNATTSQVTRLCDVTPAEMVTSLSWMTRGSHLAVGSSDGTVALWDVSKQRKIRSFSGHKARVGTMAWAQSPGWLLSTGSRDRAILHRDVRTEKNFVSRLLSHKQEVCGLKWGYNPANLLASGGNDNKLLVWDQRMNLDNVNHSQPLWRFLSHKAAVKGLAWSPHQRGLLASGGGTADQCIRFWNSGTGQEIQCIDTGSQVCNLSWSKNVNELVSTHGYSQNQIIVWSYPSLKQLATLTGHSMRVLYLSVSPDGQTIVTGAGDETLRFWSIFPKAKVSGSDRDFHSALYSLNDIR